MTAVYVDHVGFSNCIQLSTSPDPADQQNNLQQLIDIYSVVLALM